MVQPYYSSNRITIYNCDCREVIPSEIKKCDAVITDPPYDEKTHLGARYSPDEKTSRIDFAPADVKWIVPLLMSICDRWIVCFCSLEMLGEYQKNSGEWWVRAGFWHKTNCIPQFSGDRPAQPGEGIAIMHSPKKKSWARGGQPAFWETSKINISSHPTEKPLKLMQMLVSDFTIKDELIVDPFMGSGTTLLAAKNLGRKAIGIEINEKYCEIAAKKLRQEILF